MYFKDKSILITGGTGSIGKKLLEELLKYKPKKVRIFSRDEFKQFELMNTYGNNDRVRFLLGDVRDKERLIRAMEGIDIVFHLAAIKHVPASEYNPFEAVKTNVIGSQNIIEAAIYNNVEKVIYTSSDKAVSPTNTMGATKLLAERLFASADFSKGKCRTKFASVRFGNVMGSRGSVIPFFKDQILKEKRITLTVGSMTRFMMTMKQAAELTIKASLVCDGGEVFVLKMPIIKLSDLGQAVIELVCEKYGLNINDIRIEEIGLRPGEKTYEELMVAQEMKQAVEREDMFCIYPLHKQEKGNLSAESLSKMIGSRSDLGRPIKFKEVKRMILEEDLI